MHTKKSFLNLIDSFINNSISKDELKNKLETLIPNTPQRKDIVDVVIKTIENKSKSFKNQKDIFDNVIEELTKRRETFKRELERLKSNKDVLSNKFAALDHILRFEDQEQSQVQVLNSSKTRTKQKSIYQVKYEKILEEIDLKRIEKILLCLVDIRSLLLDNRYFEKHYENHTTFYDSLLLNYHDEFNTQNQTTIPNFQKLKIDHLIRMVSGEIKELYVHESSLRIKNKKLPWLHLEYFSNSMIATLESSRDIREIYELLSVGFSSPLFNLVQSLNYKTILEKLHSKDRNTIIEGLKQLKLTLENYSDDFTAEVGSTITEMLKKTESTPIEKLEEFSDCLPIYILNGIIQHFKEAPYFEKLKNHLDENITAKICRIVNEAEKFELDTVEGRISLLFSINLIGEIAKNLSFERKITLVLFKPIQDLRNDLQHIWDNANKAGKIINVLSNIEGTSIFKNIYNLLVSFKAEISTQSEIPNLTSVIHFIRKLKDIETKEKKIKISHELQVEAHNVHNILKGLNIENEYKIFIRSLYGTEYIEEQGLNNNITSFKASLDQLITVITKPENKDKIVRQLLNLLEECQANLGKILSYLPTNINNIINGSNKGEDKGDQTRRKDNFKNMSNEEIRCWKQLDLIRYFIDLLQRRTNDDFERSGNDYFKLREQYSKSPQKHYFCLFILTVIGEAARNLFAQDYRNIFFKAAGIELASQLEFLRWVRNSLAHATERIQNIEEKGFIFDYFGNDLYRLPIHEHGARRVEFNEYLSNVLCLVEQAKDNIMQGKSIAHQNPEGEFYELMIKNQLLKSYNNDDVELMKILFNNLVVVSTSLNTSSNDIIDEVEKVLSITQKLSIRTIAEKKDCIEKLAEKFKIQIIGLFGKITKIGCISDLDNSGFLISSNYSNNYLNHIASFKKELGQILNFRIKVVTQEQLAEYFKNNLGSDQDITKKVEEQIKIIEQKCSLEKLTNSYKLFQSIKDKNYFLSRMYIVGNNINLNLVIALEKFEPSTILDLLISEYWLAKVPSNKNELLSILKLFLTCDANINIQNEDGSTALISSVLGPKEEIFKILLEHKADLNIEDINMKTVLHHAAEWYKYDKYYHNNIFKILIEKGANINSGEGKQSGTPLHSAINAGNIDAAIELIKKGAKVNALDDIGRSPLHYAIKAGKNVKRCIELLLENGASVCSIYYNDGYKNAEIIPIFWALKNNYLGLTLLIIQNTSNIIELNKGNGFELPIILAVEKYFEERNKESKELYKKIIIALVEKGVDLNVGDLNIPLAVAAHHGDFDLVKLFITHGADPNCGSALSWAVDEKHYHIAKFLMENGANIDFKIMNNSEIKRTNDKNLVFIKDCLVLFRLVETGDLENIKKISKTFISFNIKDKIGNTLLCYALKSGNIQIVSYLIENGARFSYDLSYCEEDKSRYSGYRVVPGSIYRMLNRFTSQILLLLDIKGLIEWNRIDKIYLSDITKNAINSNNEALLKRLEELGILSIDFNYSVKEKLPKYLYKYFELLKMVENDDLEGIKNFVNRYPNSKSISIYNCIFYGNSILHQAAEVNACKIAQYIVENKLIGDINAFNHLNQTPYEIACENSSLEIAKLLLQYNINVSSNILDQYLYYTLFSVFNINDVKEIVNNLIRQGANINFQDEEGNSLLHKAIKYNKEQALTILLEIPNININEYNNSGYTPLHIAVSEARYIKLVSMLSNHKDIDLNARVLSLVFWATTGCVSALNYACESKNYEAIKILVHKGAVCGEDFGAVVLYALKNKDLSFIELLLRKTHILDKKEFKSFVSSWQSEDFKKEDYINIKNYLDSLIFTQLKSYKHILELIQEVVLNKIDRLSQSSYLQRGLLTMAQEEKEEESLDTDVALFQSKAEDTQFYSDEQIRNKLKAYNNLPNMEISIISPEGTIPQIIANEKPLGGTEALQHKLRTFIENDHKYLILVLRVNTLSKDFNTVNNHYVAIHLEKQVDNKIAVNYIDAMGGELGSTIYNVLLGCLGNKMNFNKVIAQNNRIQVYDVEVNSNLPIAGSNDYDCGPFVIFLISLVANKIELPQFDCIGVEFSKVLGQILREEYTKGSSIEKIQAQFLKALSLSTYIKKKEYDSFYSLYENNDVIVREYNEKLSEESEEEIITKIPDNDKEEALETISPSIPSQYNKISYKERLQQQREAGNKGNGGHQQ